METKGNNLPQERRKETEALARKYEQQDAKRKSLLNRGIVQSSEIKGKDGHK